MTADVFRVLETSSLFLESCDINNRNCSSLCVLKLYSLIFNEHELISTY